jgi:hypothetical protein
MSSVIQAFPECWYDYLREEFRLDSNEPVAPVLRALVDHAEPLTVSNAWSRLFVDEGDDEDDDLEEIVNVLTHPIWSHPKAPAIKALAPVVDSECSMYMALNAFYELLKASDPIQELEKIISKARHNVAIALKYDDPDFDPDVWIFQTTEDGLVDLSGVVENFTMLYQNPADSLDRGQTDQDHVLTPQPRSRKSAGNLLAAYAWSMDSVLVPVKLSSHEAAKASNSSLKWTETVLARPNVEGGKTYRLDQLIKELDIPNVISAASAVLAMMGPENAEVWASQNQI